MLALGAAIFLRPEPPVEPFEFTDKRVLRKGPVEVSYLDAQRAEDAQRLVDYLHQRATSLSALIEPRSTDFKLRVGYNPSLDQREFRTQLSSGEFGIVANTNFAQHPDWDMEYFGSYVLHQWIAANASQELTIEEGHWLLDGFARWWATHGDSPAAPLSGDVDPLVLEALYTMRAGLPELDYLRQWDRTTQFYGEIESMTVAYFGLRVLSDMRGNEAVMQVARDEFNRLQHHDIRDWWGRFRHPSEERFAQHADVTMDEFMQQWQLRARELMNRADYAAALAALPQASLNIEPVLTEAGGLGLRYKLELDQPLAIDTRCVALHQALRPYDVPLGRGSMRELIVYWPSAADFAGVENSTPEQGVTSIDYDLAIGEYGSGTRVFVGFECRLPGISTDVSFGQKILVMP